MAKVPVSFWVAVKRANRRLRDEGKRIRVARAGPPEFRFRLIEGDDLIDHSDNPADVEKWCRDAGALEPYEEMTPPESID